ncbi:aminopeptidase P family protein [Ideonella sp. B7]|uniref:aminopeptidase P family protein n=1 Tax=Ideonella benzenivorans TaxID=2831643 RepID=UPI001CECD86D|nr:aminopeptidase P family protein [Ideonella benzenivorans]MCA6217888.1 aminopeptidase P family protein [Ideonella benzenivorans]
MDTRHPPARRHIERLRETLRAAGLQAVLVPSSDPHLSEYLPAHWQGRVWFSGFTGSMGTLVVTLEEAAVFADSRYWVQAEAELAGSGITLVKIPTGAATHHLDWITQHVQAGQTLAVDGQVLGLAAAQQLRQVTEQAGIRLVTGQDPLAAAWDDRPGLPTAAIYDQPEADRSRRTKLALVRDALAARGATHHLVSSVDDIAWITNLRGADVEYNPVFLAHLLISPQTATLYVGAGKIPAPLATTLAAEGITLADYAQAAAGLAALPADAVLWVDPKRVTLGLREAVPAGVKVIEAINPSTLAKSRKTEAEVAHVREAMIADGVAMARFYAWFEAALARGERITEITVDEKLSAERAAQPGFVGLSFPTIAGFNANGAMPHYRATPEAHAVIEGNGLLLIDSGAQYIGGTTDITRVWPIGTPTAAQKADFTRVLRGTMNLSRAHFPLGTLSPMLDALARAPLWEAGLDYGHGTGHGVGYFLNVHEGPQSISKTQPQPDMAMQPGMITSIEPGLYRPGQWGVRIENLVLNVAAGHTDFGDYLRFETLTLCPIDTRCLDLSLLRPDEIVWLDDYHATVRERLAPRLAGDALAWLLARTEPIGI